MARISYISLLSVFVFANNVLLQGAQQHSDHTFDSFPGIRHEFKVEVQPGREICFYQNLKEQAEMHVLYQVLRGGDRTIDFFMRDSSSNLIQHDLAKNRGMSKNKIEIAGVYQVCFRNSESHFSSKLIFLYMAVFSMAQWAQYSKDLAEVHDLATNFSVKLSAVQISVSEMFKFQTLSKMHDVNDWYTITSNNKYVGYWSMFQCAVIIMTSGLQVYFLKRFFETPNVKTKISQKP